MSEAHPLFGTDIPENWQQLLADEVKANEPYSCVAGPFGSSISSKYFVEEGVPVIRGSNLRDDLTQFVPKGFVFVSNERAEHYKAQHVKADDLVFTCWGTLGQVGLIPKNGPYPEYIISNKQLKLRPNKEISDPRFLFYYFASPQMVTYIRNIAIGAAVPGINLGILKSLPVILPPLPVQRKIAAVLSAYDDLIEVNTRRIRVLEEMAQAVYREWFGVVDAGSLPVGWEVRKLSELVETQYGYTESANEVEVGPKFVRGMDINKNSYIQWNEVPYCPISENELPKFKLNVGDIMVIRMADPGKVGIVEKDINAVFASYLIRLRITSPKLSPYFLFYFLLSDRYQGYVTGASTGTTRKSASAGVITDIEMVIPPDHLRQKFEGHISTLRQLLNNLLEQNANLRRTRDLLLPRLVSGEVAVHE